MALNLIPDELVLSIAEHLAETKYISNFARTNSHFYNILNNYLYCLDARSCCTALLWAAESPNLIVAQKSLNATANPNCTHKFEPFQTPLLLAAEGGYTHMVKLLLTKEDIDINKADKFGMTPLAVAAEHESYDHKQIVLLLLARDNVDPNIKEPNTGRTPLHQAVIFENIQIVETLLARRDTDRNSLAVDNITPLNMALEFMSFILEGELEYVRMEIDKDECKILGIPFILSRRRQAIIELLLNSGANPNVVDANGTAPLLEACTSEKTTELLLSANANTNISNARSTPLVEAIITLQNDRIIELLLEAGADVNTRGESGRTPLSWAAEFGHEKIVRLLLDAGALWDDGGSRDHNPPLDCAVKWGHEQIVILLLEASSKGKQDEHTYRDLLSMAKFLGYSSIFDTLSRNRPYLANNWNNSYVPTGFARHGAKKDITRILETLETESFVETVLRHNKWDNDVDNVVDNVYNQNLANLTKYQILPYEYGVFREWVVPKFPFGLAGWKIARPYLAVIVSTNDNPKKLVRELENRSDIGVFASTVDGKIVAGTYEGPVYLSWKRYLQPCILSPTKPWPPVWLLDIYVKKMGVNVNLASVVEQAARECKYFGNFTTETGMLRVVRTDPGDSPWVGPKLRITW